MDELTIEGPSTLRGKVKVSGSKNACLPIMAATILSNKKVILRNIPELLDVKTMSKLLQNLGVSVQNKDSLDNGKILTMNACHVKSFEATYDLVKTMRASILVLGPLLARFKKGKVSLPGGCAIGTRPIDIHLNALEKMGAKIDLNGGYVEAETSGLRGAEIHLPFPSVGATENVMMAGVLAEGVTCIKNAAMEPEIEDLANFLNKMGAFIKGAGTPNIVIEGVRELKDVDYDVIGDRIEGATLIIAAILTNSEVTVEGINPEYIKAVLDVLKNMGAQFKVYQNSIEVLKRGPLHGVRVDTAPFPGFPTDAQAQLMTLTLLGQTPSCITEHIFENRFMHVPELNRLGADIHLRGNSAFIPGKTNLKGAPLMCTDLRASAALVLAGLAAHGKTIIKRVYHLDRGYERLDNKLRKLGVKIERNSR